MSDLFNQLKKTVSDNLPRNAPSNTAGMLGAAGVGGLIGALFGGSKSVKRAAKNVAVVGGSAALAAVAYKMYQSWSNKNSSTSAPAPQNGMPYGNNGNAYNTGYGTQSGGYGQSTVAGDNPFAEFNQAQQLPMLGMDVQGKLIIQAMVFAARADGHIDAQEQEAIMTAAKTFGTSDLNNYIRECLNKPLDPRDLASQVQNQEQALDIYRLSAAAIVADHPQEMQYLNDLAQALQINSQNKGQLDLEAHQMRLILTQGN